MGDVVHRFAPSRVGSFGTDDTPRVPYTQDYEGSQFAEQAPSSGYFPTAVNSLFVLDRGDGCWYATTYKLNAATARIDLVIGGITRSLYPYNYTSTSTRPFRTNVGGGRAVFRSAVVGAPAGAITSAIAYDAAGGSLGAITVAGGVYYYAAEMTVSTSPFWTPGSTGSTSYLSSAWHCSNPHAVPTEAPYQYDMYLTSGPSGQMSTSEWRPANLAWDTPNGVWPDVYLQGSCNKWGSVGGFFFRMNNNHTSWWLIDRNGLHYVSGTTYDTVVTFEHAKTDGDWFELNAVGNYIQVIVRDETFGSGAYRTYGPFHDSRNQDGAIHGFMDSMDASFITHFRYFDCFFAGEYGERLVGSVATIDATGQIDVQVIRPTLRDDIQGAIGTRQPVNLETKDNDGLVVVYMEEVDTLDYVDAHPEIAVQVNADLTSRAYLLGTAGVNGSTYGKGLSRDQVFMTHDYANSPFPDTYIDWLGGLASNLDMAGTGADVIFHPRPTGMIQ